AKADLEIAGNERGGRNFVDTQGKGSTQEVVAFKSATAQWYKDLTNGPKPLKRDQIEKAIQKIITDEGTDVGTAVERVKEALLHDREFSKTPWGEDAEAIMRGEWPSWIPKPNTPSQPSPALEKSSALLPSTANQTKQPTETAFLRETADTKGVPDSTRSDAKS